MGLETDPLKATESFRAEHSQHRGEQEREQTHCQCAVSWVHRLVRSEQERPVDSAEGVPGGEENPNSEGEPDNSDAAIQAARLLISVLMTPFREGNCYGRTTCLTRAPPRSNSLSRIFLTHSSQLFECSKSGSVSNSVHQGAIFVLSCFKDCSPHSRACQHGDQATGTHYLPGEEIKAT